MINNDKIKQYAKNQLFPSSGIEKNFYIRPHYQNYEIPFILFPRQRDLIKAYNNNSFNLVVKSRQVGVSKITEAYLADKVLYADENTPEVILVISSNLHKASKILLNIKEFINQIPRAHWGPKYYGSIENEKRLIFIKNTTTEIKLPNGSIIKANGGIIERLAGYNPTFIYMDEAAYINLSDTVFNILVHSLGVNGKMIIVSTPNGKDKFFYDCYYKIKNGYLSIFNIFEIKWYHNPRFNEDLKWIKNNEEISCEAEFYDKMINDGWQPTSPWYKSMFNNIGVSYKRNIQEINAEFL